MKSFGSFLLPETYLTNDQNMISNKLLFFFIPLMVIKQSDCTKSVIMLYIAEDSIPFHSWHIRSLQISYL